MAAKKGIIKCSQCGEEFPGGYDYRMHFEKHLNDFLKYGLEYCKERNNIVK